MASWRQLKSQEHNFVLGVQWHPEYLTPFVEVSKKIFTSFINASMDAVKDDTTAKLYSWDDSTMSPAIIAEGTLAEINNAALLMFTSFQDDFIHEHLTILVLQNYEAQ